MHVERYGAGADCYFGLHGWGGDRRTFAPLAPFVPAGASFFSADLPGCGGSPAPRELSLEAVVSEVAAAVVSNCAGGATLVGSCGGAVFALLAAERVGDAVRRVVMLDPFAYLPRYLSLFASGGFGRRAYQATFANPVGRWLTNQSLRRRRAGGADLTATFAETDHEVARRYLQLFAEVGGVERFRGARVPVDLVYGEKTFGAVRRSITLWRDVLPRARAFELAGAGHLPIEEQPGRLSEIVFGLSGARTEVKERPSGRANEPAGESEARF